jgi:hypothetical protein
LFIYLCYLFFHLFIYLFIYLFIIIYLFLFVCFNVGYVPCWVRVVKGTEVTLVDEENNVRKKFDNFEIKAKININQKKKKKKKILNSNK